MTLFLSSLAITELKIKTEHLAIPLMTKTPFLHNSVNGGKVLTSEGLRINILSHTTH
jgi:hypothetical protein